MPFIWSPQPYAQNAPEAGIRWSVFKGAIRGWTGKQGAVGSAGLGIAQEAGEADRFAICEMEYNLYGYKLQ